MKKYRASIVFEYNEKDIRETLKEMGEAPPSDKEIEVWMRDEMHELVEDPNAYDIQFDVIEVKEK